MKNDGKRITRITILSHTTREPAAIEKPSSVREIYSHETVRPGGRRNVIAGGSPLVFRFPVRLVSENVCALNVILYDNNTHGLHANVWFCNQRIPRIVTFSIGESYALTYFFDTTPTVFAVPEIVEDGRAGGERNV